MLNLHYDIKTGIVMSYQEGPNATLMEEIPAGCGLISVLSSYGVFDGATGLCIYKVDPEKRQLVSLKIPQIVSA